MIYLVYIPGRCCCLRPADSAHSHCAPPTRPRWGSSSAELRSTSGVCQRRSFLASMCRYYIFFTYELRVLLAQPIGVPPLHNDGGNQRLLLKVNLDNK